MLLFTKYFISVSVFYKCQSVLHNFLQVIMHGWRPGSWSSVPGVRNCTCMCTIWLSRKTHVKWRNISRNVTVLNKSVWFVDTGWVMWEWGYVEGELMEQWRLRWGKDEKILLFYKIYGWTTPRTCLASMSAGYTYTPYQQSRHSQQIVYISPRWPISRVYCDSKIPQNKPNYWQDHYIKTSLGWTTQPSVRGRILCCKWLVFLYFFQGSSVTRVSLSSLLYQTWWISSLTLVVS